jgi:DNA-binding SARP family transcriptional activator
VVTAWKIAVLRANGRTSQAIEVYERTVAASTSPLGMLTFLGPELYVDAGDGPKARRAMAAARARYQEIGAPGWAACVAFSEARLELRSQGDPAAARRALDAIDAPAFAGGHLFRGTLGVWYGLADLAEGKDEEALTRLRETVELMGATGGHIEMPAAAVYLSEAEWRGGDEEAADAAADLALEVAHAQGSNHILLQGLGDFPAVVSRKIDAELRTDSPWHELGRALMAQRVAVPGYGEHTVLIREFGEPAIVIDGEPARAPLTKCIELLAVLAARDGAAANRAELLDALFDGRDDGSARSYLRQVIHRLRALLPEEALVADGMAVRLGERVAVSSESGRLLARLAEALRLSGTKRLGALLEALPAGERGAYLPRVEADWARRRAAEIDERCLEARIEAAEIAFVAGDYPLARRLGEEAVAADPFRESGWQLLIRIATEVGDTAAATLALRRCETALAEVGGAPTGATRALAGI